MPVDFGGLLKSIPTGQVVGSVPASAPNDSMNSLAGGIMQGIQQGQQIGLNEKQGQYMDTKNAEAKLDLGTKEKAVAYADKLEAAATQGEDAWLKAQTPGDRYTSLKAKADMNKSIAEANKAGVDAGYSMAHYIGSANSAGLSAQQVGQDPQAAYQQIRDVAPEDVKSRMPEQFNPQIAPVAVSTGMVAEAAYLRRIHGAAGDTSSTATQKDAVAVSQLKQRIAANPNDQDAKDQLQFIESGQKNQRQVLNPLDSELAKTDAKIVEVANDLRNQMVSFRDFNGEAQKKLQSTPKYALGPVANILALDQLNPDAAELKGYLAASTLLAKNILGLKGGTQGFTDAERKFVEQVAGSTFQTTETLQSLLPKMDALSRKVEGREWKKESNVRKGSDNYAAWLESNPEPSSEAPKAQESKAATAASKVWVRDPKTGKLSAQ